LHKIECTSQAGQDGYLVFVGNIGSSMTENALHQILKPLGSINFIRVARDPHTGYPLGYAFVAMRHKDEAARVVRKANETRIGNRYLVARPIF
jgi:RNA recognition motif-containing protein